MVVLIFSNGNSRSKNRELSIILIHVITTEDRQNHGDQQDWNGAAIDTMTPLGISVRRRSKPQEAIHHVNDTDQSEDTFGSHQLVSTLSLGCSVVKPITMQQIQTNDSLE
jgi:hypothetical protein